MEWKNSEVVLPEDDVKIVLVYDSSINDGEYYIAEVHDNNTWIENSYDAMMYNMQGTFWMPLPEPPKE